MIMKQTLEKNMVAAAVVDDEVAWGSCTLR